MRRLMMMLAALALTAACDSRDNTPTGPSTSGPIVLTADLLASNEVPAVTNAEAGARGTVTITLNVARDPAGTPTAGGTVTFEVQLRSFPAGTAAILAHIHTAPATSNGPVLVDTGLAPTAPVLLNDGTASVAITRPITQAQAAQITANPGGHYFNVHTPLNPGGVVRGQLARQ